MATTGPQHNQHQTGPQNWVVWYGPGTFAGQLGLVDFPIPGVPGPGASFTVPNADAPHVAAVYAMPLAQVTIEAADPYYIVHVGAVSGTFLNVVQKCPDAQAALLDANTVAAARQFKLEQSVFGDWITTIRPKLAGDTDDDVQQGPDGTSYKLGAIQLSDSRYFMTPDHHWHNRNHPADDLGWALAACDPPRHGVSGAIAGLGDILSAAWKDCLHNPLGAALLLLVLVSAAPAAPIFAGAAQVVTVAAAASGNLGKEAAAAKWVAEHPAETGEIAASIELIVAGTAVGGKLGQTLGKKLGAGLLDKGVSDAIGASLPAGFSLPTTPPAPGDQVANIVPDRAYWWTFFHL